MNKWIYKKINVNDQLFATQIAKPSSPEADLKPFWQVTHPYPGTTNPHPFKFEPALLAEDEAWQTPLTLNWPFGQQIPLTKL